MTTQVLPPSTSGPAASRISIAIPVLETERLILRAPHADDFEHVAAFFADAGRSWGFGGPSDRAEAWRWFAGLIGHWAIRGFGFWIIVDRTTDTPIGLTGIWEPEGWPEPELGWVMFEGSEGKGYAFEAAQAARAHAYNVWGMSALTSNIFPGNTRSVALAERMGAVHERDYENVKHGTEMVYRHPGPKEIAA
ncbi:GNAT family acetyltransferase [Sulfitobacter porphyrae]|nr:GNAT family acetyltransferase [Sulfitobacter porphyrae]